MHGNEYLTLKMAAALAFAQVAGLAQVETVEILTSGISCGVCAAVSEFQFRRMEGISKVTISLPKESITLKYQANTWFSLQSIQAVLEPLHVQVLRIRVEARGRIEIGSEGKKFLVAGRNRFPVRLPAGTAMIDPGAQLLVDGVLLGSGECKVVKISITEKGGNRYGTP